MKNKSKGFTLVELLIVIVIIGILAAILIPTFSGVINDAKFSSDAAAASSMTTEVAMHMSRNGISEITAPDVLTICGIDELVSSKPKLWGFFFNMKTNTIEAKKYGEDVKTNYFQTSSRIKNAVYADATYTGYQLEEVVPGYLLLDTSGNIIADTLTFLRNELALSANPTTEFTGIIGQLTGNEEVPEGFTTNLNSNFSPETTIYITSSTICNEVPAYIEKGDEEGTEAVSEKNLVKNLVFERGIEYLTSNNVLTCELMSDTKIFIPASVKAVEKNALRGVSSANTIVFVNPTTLIEEGALSDKLKTANAIVEVARDLSEGNEKVTVTVTVTEVEQEPTNTSKDQSEYATFTYELTDEAQIPQVTLNIEHLENRDSMIVTQYAAHKCTVIEYRIYSETGKIAHVKIEFIRQPSSNNAPTEPNTEG